MRYLFLVVLITILCACDQHAVEKFSFRKTLEYQLVDKCGEDQHCIKVVETKTEGCMEQSSWKQFVDNQDDQIEFKRFISEFYSCLVDRKGKPLFHPNV